MSKSTHNKPEPKKHEYHQRSIHRMKLDIQNI